MAASIPALANTVSGASRPALAAWREALPQALRSRVSSASELVRRQRQSTAEPLPTAEPVLDRLLGGGLARRALTEVVGGRSSGRFSLLLSVLAATTGAGDAAAIVDLGDSLDPQAAAQAGVDLTRLLWARPDHLGAALSAAETLLTAGFPLVVLDLGLPPIRGGRGAEGFWLRLARTAEERGATLVVATPYRVSGTAAAMVLELERQPGGWLGSGAAPHLLASVSSRLTVAKHRGQAPGDHQTLGWKTSRLLGELAARAQAPAPARTLVRDRDLPLAAVGGAR